MTKIISVDQILDEMSFSKEQKESFMRCIAAVKQEQKDDSFKAEPEIRKIIEEGVNK